MNPRIAISGASTDQVRVSPRRLGPFELHEPIGAGGMGTVHRAFRLGPGGFRKQVAIKLVNNKNPNDARRWRKILLNEAYHGAMLKHPNIVETFEVGDAGGALYISMEYIDGPNLSQVLNAHGHLPLSAVLSLGIQLCKGLTHAHTLNLTKGPAPVVHCDLKPSNIIVDRDGCAHIIDLGVAVLEGMALGDQGTLCGTMAYMSPHVLSGSPAGPWVDLFGVGAILYEAATGVRLLSGGTSKELIPEILALHRVLETGERLAPLTEISAPLAAVVRALLLSNGVSGLLSAHDAQTRLRAIVGAAERCPALGAIAADTPRGGVGTQKALTLGMSDINESVVWSPATWPFDTDIGPFRGSIASMENPMDVMLEIGRVDLGDGRVVPKKGHSGASTLSPLEAKLLAYFAKHPGAIVRQEDLLKEVWAYHPDSSSRTVFTTISRLRTKIERDPQIPRHLVTVPRRGYRFLPLDTGLAVDTVTDVHPTNLVDRSDAFIGREAEMTQMLAMLGPGKLVCVKGTGGIGKTRLAQEAGQRVLASWPDGVWMCRLSDARTAEDAIRRVASGLGIVCGSTAVDELPAFLGEAIAARPEILIILDNGEQIVEILSELVSVWRHQAHSACFLVTSREPLRIKGEQVLELSPLPPADAVDLLIQRAACATPPCTLSHTALLEEIVARVDHLPLAIELVAGRLGILKPSAILEHLKKRFRLLRSRLRDRPARHTALHATIDWSWQILSPEEQATLAQLSVFRGGFDYSSAAAVVDLSQWEEEAFLLDVISGLLEKSLLQARNVGNTTRLNMYLSVRDFAEGHLAQMEAEDPSWAAHRVGYRHACFQARRGTVPSLRALNCHGGAELRGALALELPNLMTAIETASNEGEDETAAHCAIAAFEILLTRGPFDQARSVSEQILSSTRLSLVTRGRLQYCQSELDRLSGRIEVAIRGFREVMLLADEHGEEMLAARAAAQLATILGGTEQDDEARRLIARSIRTAEDCDDSRHLSFFLCRLGMIDLNQGCVAEAREALGGSLQAANAAGDKWTEGVALHAMASCDMSDGDLVNAKRRCEAAIQAYRTVGSVRDEATVYGALGQVEDAQGDVDGARAAFQTAVKLCGRVGHGVPQGIFLGMLGELEGQAGHFDAAHEYLERGEAVLRRTEELREVAKLLCRRGRVELALDDYEAAGRALQQAEKATDSVLISSGSELGQSLAQLRDALLRKS